MLASLAPSSVQPEPSTLRSPGKLQGRRWRWSRRAWEWSRSQLAGSGSRGGVPDAARPDLAGVDSGLLLGLARIGEVGEESMGSRHGTGGRTMHPSPAGSPRRGAAPARWPSPEGWRRELVGSSELSARMHSPGSACQIQGIRVSVRTTRWCRPGARTPVTSRNYALVNAAGAAGEQGGSDRPPSDNGDVLSDRSQLQLLSLATKLA